MQEWRTNSSARRKAFFYAEAEAQAYDAAADLNTPLFSLMHETMLALVRQHRESSLPEPKAEPFSILDIGSGTGAESMDLLVQYPQSQVVALDLCKPMHALFKAKAADILGSAKLAKRIKFLTGDVAGPVGSAANLRRTLREWTGADRYDIVITALTLHHLSTSEKRRVYSRIASVLRLGGLFLNGDLFTYATPTLAQAAQDFGLDWIRKQFTNPDRTLKKARDSLGSKAGPMMDLWLDHYVKYNTPDPIESSSDAGIGVGEVQGQASMLTAAGFREVACPFRFWEVGILWGLR
jgi:tRNA (cmo5U34)-methyltransferase